MDALVTTNPDIFGGMPVFEGTRLPIAVVLDSLAEGSALEQLQGHGPYLTEAHIHAARAYNGPSLVEAMDAIRGDCGDIEFEPPRLFGGQVVRSQLLDADEVLRKLQAKLDAAKDRLRRGGVP